MGVHNLFQSNTLLTSCFNLCSKNLSEKRRDSKEWGTYMPNRNKIMNFNWNLTKSKPKKSKKKETKRTKKEEETQKICMWFVFHRWNLFSSFFVFINFFSPCVLFLFVFLPVLFFCSLCDLLLLKRTTTACEYVYHICLCLCVYFVCATLFKQMCFNVWMCVGICRVVFTTPLKMVDNIFFWWQQTALQRQQRYQTHWILTRFGCGIVEEE